MHKLIRPATALALLSGLTITTAWAGVKPATVKFSGCTEFVGITPVDAAKARAQVPARYMLVTDGASARLLLRVVDCQSIQVGSLPARRGRIGQIGLVIESPDGTASDPNTGINNYLLRYATNLPELAGNLKLANVNATVDTALAYEQSPASGAAEFYAAVSPELGTGPRWFVHGSVNDPGFQTRFLANWWQLAGTNEVKMATDIPAIAFDFGSVVSLTTSRKGPVGSLLTTNNPPPFPVSFRGAFPAGTMLTTVNP
jgi:hypothetical protein